MNLTTELIDKKITTARYKRREAAQDDKAEVAALYSLFIDWLLEIKATIL